MTDQQLVECPECGDLAELLPDGSAIACSSCGLSPMESPC